MAVTIHSGSVYFEAGSEPYDSGAGFGATYNIQVKLDDPPPAGVKVHQKYETVAVYAPANNSKDTEYVRSLKKGDRVQLAWQGDQGGKRKNMTIIVPGEFGKVKDEHEGTPPWENTPPLKTNAPRTIAPQAIYWEPFGVDELHAALAIMNHEIQLLEAAWIAVSTSPTFANLTEDAARAFAITAYIQANRTHRRGMVIKPERQEMDEALLVEDVKNSVEKGNSLILAVMTATLNVCQTIDKLEDLIEVLKRFGQGREAINESEESWVALARIAFTYDNFILEGQSPDQAAHSTGDALNILSF
jgi:hypothetical protein